MKSEVRQPKQERAIEKKNKILRTGYDVFAEKGYYGTNTAEIAKRAGVSIGIVYGYFADKRDILLNVLDLYLQKISEPIMGILKDATQLSLPQTIEQIVRQTVQVHRDNANMHKMLHSLAATDESVNERFLSTQDHATEKFTKRLTELGVTVPNLRERVHLAIDIIEAFAHETVYDQHPYLDYAALEKVVCNTITHLFV